ncbi:MAG: NAD-dependent epimerase/dehydratase family protein [Myxococcota bacterium]
MNVLVTGAAGFIGYHVTSRLLADGHTVIGLDSLNAYYDPALKRGRLAELGIQGDAETSPTHPGLRFIALDLTRSEEVAAALSDTDIDVIVHLAAQVGVRYSIENPKAYIDSNLVAFGTILEVARTKEVAHLVYASSSSVYGGNTEVPFETDQRVDQPISLYAATKRANELMAHTYSHLYGLPTTGLRFFTVYGPWGRPDMAYFSFTKKILAGETIDVYNHGEMSRDFTYVGDIVEGLTRIVGAPPITTGGAPYRLYNLGNGTPVGLRDFISEIEAALGVKATLNLMAMQPGDMAHTWADTTALERDHDYRPATPLAVGVKAFVDWYRAHYD